MGLCASHNLHTTLPPAAVAAVPAALLPFLLTQGCHIQLKEVLLVTWLCLAGNKDQLVSLQHWRPVMLGRSSAIETQSTVPQSSQLALCRAKGGPRHCTGPCTTLYSVCSACCLQFAVQSGEKSGVLPIQKSSLHYMYICHE